MTWLSKLGLMRVSEHEELVKNSVLFHLRNYSSLERHRDDLKAEINSLRSDLAVQAGRLEGLVTANGQCADHIANLNNEIDCYADKNVELNEEIGRLLPDALLWRAARDRRANNRKGKA